MFFSMYKLNCNSGFKTDHFKEQFQRIVLNFNAGYYLAKIHFNFEKLLCDRQILIEGLNLGTETICTFPNTSHAL